MVRKIFNFFENSLNFWRQFDFSLILKIFYFLRITRKMRKKLRFSQLILLSCFYDFSEEFEFIMNRSNKCSKLRKKSEISNKFRGISKHCWKVLIFHANFSLNQPSSQIFSDVGIQRIAENSEKILEKSMKSPEMSSFSEKFSDIQRNIITTETTQLSKIVNFSWVHTFYSIQHNEYNILFVFPLLLKTLNTLLRRSAAHDNRVLSHLKIS